MGAALGKTLPGISEEQRTEPSTNEPSAVKALEGKSMESRSYKNEPFKHEPLDLDRTQIQLFRLFSRDPGGILIGDIAIFELDNCPRYKTVSYTWGPPEPTREILIKGRNFLIRDNLWQFLIVANNVIGDWLWIDQICIDQSTVKERNYQVSIMSKIYEESLKVFIWLGTEADDSYQAIDAIR